MLSGVRRWKAPNKLGEVGRPLGHSAVDQIEKGTRRVDVDDLVALALALDVSPITLLMPDMPGADDPAKMVAVAGMDTKVSAGRLWLWLRGEASVTSVSDLALLVNAQPQWQHARWIKETGSDGDD
ncbi:MAG TPA: helix-turn-helix transcriptional regulator [Mycobacterium sp.]|nr:helix-turn-helix transcriptional regulator [Mycobacterium sp.]